MRKIFIVFALIASLPAVAQERPRFQVFGGYSYLNTPKDFSCNEYLHIASDTGGASQNGWNASFAVKLFKSLDFVADTSSNFQYGIRTVKFTGSNQNQISTTSTTHTFLFGPQVRFPGGKKLHPFGRTLFGISKQDRDLTVDSSDWTWGGNFTDTGFAFAVGGGLDWQCSKKISIRLLQADYIRAKKDFTYDWYLFYGNNSITNDRIANNFRIAAGLVFNIGRR
jgi:hypothetical protein